MIYLLLIGFLKVALDKGKPFPILRKGFKFIVYP